MNVSSREQILIVQPGLVYSFIALNIETESIFNIFVIVLPFLIILLYEIHHCFTCEKKKDYLSFIKVDVIHFVVCTIAIILRVYI